MTAAEFQRKWYDDPRRLRMFTDKGSSTPFLSSYRADAASDLASLSPEDRAIVSAKFPPMIWGELPAVKGQIVVQNPLDMPESEPPN